MTDEMKQVFLWYCLGMYALIAYITKTTSASTIDGIITAVVFTIIAIAAYTASNRS